MKYSQLFTKTSKRNPTDEVSVNAKLLVRGEFIRKEMAGVYTFLPLGLRVLEKIENIVREEMNKAGGQEVLMPALHPKQNWQKTGRWDSFDALFKTKSRYDQEYAIGPTHEEILYPLLTKYIQSYKDLPVYIYQIQTKFRDEPRAKSGLLRGREFRMKDLYSFHSTSEDRDKYYEVMRKAYLEVFKRLGLSAIETQASGGTFSELSLEFQVACEAGEDSILVCEKCGFAVNEEIAKDNKCPKCGGETKKVKVIEVGNIFPLKDKYSKDFGLTFKDKDGKDKLVSAGCYGLGTSRVMGTIVEVFHDEQGIIWPRQVAPYQVHLIHLGGILSATSEVYERLMKAGVEVLWDDRTDVSAGEKFADADLIGIPVRLVVSEKTGNGKVEWKERSKRELEILTIEQVLGRLNK